MFKSTTIDNNLRTPRLIKIDVKIPIDKFIIQQK